LGVIPKAKVAPKIWFYSHNFQNIWLYVAPFSNSVVQVLVLSELDSESVGVGYEREIQGYQDQLSLHACLS